ALAMALSASVALATTPDLTCTVLGANATRSGTSFAANASRIPAAAYFRTDRNLYWYRYAGTSWGEELVAPIVVSNGARNYTQLVYLNDRPHIVFYDSLADQLKHAERGADGTWAVDTIDATGHVGSYPSAVACGYGKICVAYYDIDDGDLKVANG